jgi:membrane carboxypeptidase/penicillin-binding protein PbpC
VSAPTITTQPSFAGNKKVGDSITLSAVATGGGLTYQWYKGSAIISGATATSYTFTAAANSPGSYKVRATNIAGSIDSTPVSVTLVSAPTITTQPSFAGNKKVGDSITLSAVATGGGLTYQWYKGSAIISGATATSYTFTAAANSPGSYKVRVTNIAGSIDSTAVTVTLVSVPTITTQPSFAGNKKVGDSITLSAVATGGGLSYQWYKGSAIISGATATSYTFTAAANSPGSYKVRVTNIAGSIDSTAVTVTLVSAPTITTQPSFAGNKKVGDSITLSAVATGGGLTYQWYKDGTAISGATAASYTFTAATDKAGSYKVKVTNIAGYIESTPVSVAVISEPTITTQPEGQIKEAGGQVNLRVTAGKNGSLNYQWYKGDTAIIGATDSVYNFTMSSDKVGNYKVKISNALGQVTSNVVAVDLMTAPIITSQPSLSGNKAANHAVALIVNASGYNLSYQWYKGNIAITGATYPSYNTTAGDGSGAYKVIVSNEAGSVESSVVNVAVTLTKPTITTQPSISGTPKTGERVTLSVVATGGDLTYRWYKDEVFIQGAELDSYSFILDSNTIGTYQVFYQ